MMDVSVGKKTLGKRKIEIKKMEKKAHLAVTFNKRRNGLFKKATELNVLCGAEIAILVQSPGGKIFTFGHPSADAVTQRFTVMAYEEEVMRLEMEKRRTEEKENEEELMWWDKPLEDMELQELEEYLKSLQCLSDNVSKKAEEMEKLKTSYYDPSVFIDCDPIEFIDFTC